MKKSIQFLNKNTSKSLSYNMTTHIITFYTKKSLIERESLMQRVS